MQRINSYIGILIYQSMFKYLISLLGLFKSDYGLKCITWQPDSTVIAFGDCDGTILLVDSRCPGAAFKTIYGFSAEIQNLEFCPTK